LSNLRTTKMKKIIDFKDLIEENIESLTN